VSDDLKKVVASVYLSRNGGPLSTVEFVGILSYNLRFFTHDKAQAVHRVALGSGLLTPQGQNMYVPSFDPGSLEVEPDFRPDPDMDLERYDRSLSERLIEAVCGPGLARKDAIRLINRAAESMNLLFPAAAIYVGIDHGRDMSSFFSEVQSTFIAPSR